MSAPRLAGGSLAPASPRARANPNRVRDRELQGLLIQILHSLALVTSDEPSVLRRLAAIFQDTRAVSGARGEAAVREPSARAAFEVVRTDGSPAGCYLVSERGQARASCASAALAVAEIDDLVTTSAILDLWGSYLLLHAGLVDTPSGALMIPGRSGAGKSTLVAALSLAGFGYFSDEIAVIEPSTSAVRPFAKAPCLKAGGWRALLRDFESPSVAPTPRVDGLAVRYVEVPSRATNDATARVRWVLLPARERGARPGVRPVSRARVLAELAANSLNLPSRAPDAIETLARLVEEAECLELEYDSPREALRVVASLAGHPAVAGSFTHTRKAGLAGAETFGGPR